MRIIRPAFAFLIVLASLRRGKHVRPLAEFALGNSIDGTPARPGMYFRIGSMAIPDMITVLLQLQDEGRLSLDEHLRLPRLDPGQPAPDRLRQGQACEPGSCFRYAHTNLSVLSQVIAKVTGHSVE